jgi:hypothetical protein
MRDLPRPHYPVRIFEETLMDSGQTLHDFVLNLLSDPHARTAFDLNPEGALHDAGLSDITAADVQDVIPLVIDYAPVQGLPELDNSLNGLGLDALSASPAGAIHQLQLVTQQILPGAQSVSSDANLAAAGAITTGAQGLTSWLSATSTGGQYTVDAGSAVHLPHAFSSDGDVSVTLDSHALDTAGLVDQAGTTGAVVGAVDGVAHPLTGGLTDGLNVGGVDVGGLTGNLHGLTDLHNLTGTVGGLTGTVGGLTGGLHGLTGDLTGSVDASPGHASPLTAHLPVVDSLHSTVSQVGDTVQHTAGVGDVLGHDSHLLDTSHLPVAGDLLGGTTDHLLF